MLRLSVYEFATICLALISLLWSSQMRVHAATSAQADLYQRPGSELDERRDSPRSKYNFGFDSNLVASNSERRTAAPAQYAPTTAATYPWPDFSATSTTTRPGIYQTGTAAAASQYPTAYPATSSYSTTYRPSYLGSINTNAQQSYSTTYRPSYLSTLNTNAQHSFSTASSSSASSASSSSSSSSASSFASTQANKHPNSSGNASRVIDQFNRRYPDGSYEFRYELSDGTTRYERGYFLLIDKLKSLVVVGYYSYRMPNGRYLTVFYNADQNGYRQNQSITPQSYPNLPRSIEVPELKAFEVTETSRSTQTISRQPQFSSSTARTTAQNQF